MAAENRECGTLVPSGSGVFIYFKETDEGYRVAIHHRVGSGLSALIFIGEGHDLSTALCNLADAIDRNPEKRRQLLDLAWDPVMMRLLASQREERR